MTSIAHWTLHFPTFTKTRTRTTTKTTCSYKPKNPNHQQQKQEEIAARDRVINFGRHKGRMLGTLPSTYLKWVSNNLRAGDTEHWARLADQVLQDPVYKDRIEWEFADSVLNGNKPNFGSNSGSGSEGAVSKLVEISERFGWDNEDKVGWSKVDFGLLGTSKGGRIPRMPLAGEEKRRVVEEKRGVDLVSESGERRRRERRERVRLKKEIDSGGGGGRGSLVNLGSSIVDEGVRDRRVVKKVGEDRTVEVYNPFPGRDSLSKVLLDRKKRSI